MNLFKLNFEPAKKYIRNQVPVVTKSEAEAHSRAMLIVGAAAGLAAGALVGAGVALLLAPQGGEETRRIIKEGCEAQGAAVKDATEKIGEKIKEAASCHCDEDVTVEYTIHYDDEPEEAPAEEAEETESQEAEETAPEE